MTRSVAVKVGRRPEAVPNRRCAPPRGYSCTSMARRLLIHWVLVAHISSCTFVLAPTFTSFCSALCPRTCSQHLLELRPMARLARVAGFSPRQPC